MDNEEEFLLMFFTHISQLCFDKAKEHVERGCDKNRTGSNIISGSSWNTLLNYLPQIALAEKSYMEIGFLQNKNKSFLRKDNSLKSVYESLKGDLRKLEDNCKQINNTCVTNICQNLGQFFTARINLINFYEKIHLTGGSRFLKYNELLIQIENIIQKHVLGFTNISLTPMKALFSIECEILQQLFKALTELQRLQFLPSLALINGAHTRLLAWESKMQNRETWKLGFLKNNPLPLLYQWLFKLKGAVLSKFSLYFHDTLALQTTSHDIRQLCSKLQYDYYQKMTTFQRKYDATSVLLVSDNQVSCDTTNYDSFPIIISCPIKSPSQQDTILKMITDTSVELLNGDKIIYKYSSQEQRTYIISIVESNIYLVLIFESKRSEKDVFIGNFIMETCTNLRSQSHIVEVSNNCCGLFTKNLTEVEGNLDKTAFYLQLSV